MDTSQQIIEQTKKWINDVVIGCNFCPFASNVVSRLKVHYEVEFTDSVKEGGEALLREAKRLDGDESIETVFLIFPRSFVVFDDYLGMVTAGERLLKKNGYTGIYQLASFHPLYLFADSAENDAANYTNRSVYPMLHLLRESGIDRALENYKNPGSIPARNINFAREKGLTYMKMLRDGCL